MNKQLFRILVFFLIIGCSSNDEDFQNDSTLIGIWQNIEEVNSEDIEQNLEEGDYIITQQIEFMTDNSFEQLTYLTNKDNQEIIGYLSRNDGTYLIGEDRLQINFDRYYSNTEFSTTFTSIDNLVLIHDNQQESFEYTLSESQNRLIFDFDPCAPNAFCLDKIEFQRSN